MRFARPRWGTGARVASTTDDEQLALAASGLVRRLGTDGTRELLALLGYPEDIPPEALAKVRGLGTRGVVIAEIAERLHRDQPLLRRFVPALQQAAAFDVG